VRDVSSTTDGNSATAADAAAPSPRDEQQAQAGSPASAQLDDSSIDRTRGDSFLEFSPATSSSSSRHTPRSKNGFTTSEAVAHIQTRWRESRAQAAAQARAATLESKRFKAALAMMNNGSPDNSEVDTRTPPRDALEDGVDLNDSLQSPSSETQAQAELPSDDDASMKASEEGAASQNSQLHPTGSFSNLNLSLSNDTAPLKKKSQQEEDEEDLLMWHQDNEESEEAVLQIQRRWRRRNSQRPAATTEPDGHSGELPGSTLDDDIVTPRHGARTPPHSPKLSPQANFTDTGPETPQVVACCSPL